MKVTVGGQYTNFYMSNIYELDFCTAKLISLLLLSLYSLMTKISSLSKLGQQSNKHNSKLAV